MTSKRLLMPVVVVGIMLIMASASFAQTAINCGLSVPVGSTPRATGTGHTEPIGAGAPVVVGPAKVSPPTDGGGVIRVTCINAGGAGSANDPGVVVLTLGLGIPITNSTAHPSTATGIRIGTGANGALAPTGDFSAANVSINSLSNSGGTIVIGLGTPTGTPATGITFTAGSTSFFELAGVLVSTNGRTTPVVANLTSTGGITVGGTAGPATVQVIDSILPGLQDPTVPTSLPGLPAFAGVSGGAAVLNSAGIAVKGNFTLRIQENYPDMFREATQFNGPTTSGVFPVSPSSDTQVQVILSNIPSGLDISNCSTVTTNAAASAISAGSPTINFTNITAASPILTVNFNAPLDLDNIDVLWVICAQVAVGSATLPLPSTPVTVQVQLGPTGAALSTGPGNPPLTSLTTGQIPRYQSLLQPSTPLTVVVFPPSNTTLLTSFAFVGPGYNTGISIANTTVDPFGTAGGGAAASSGTVSFLLVKNDGTSRTYTTTTGSPGGGLTGAGVVASGSTYVVNLSEILAAANFGTTFSGYVFITANFTFAHGAATIYTTSTGAAALSSPVLVLPAVSTAAVRGTPESLGQ